MALARISRDRRIPYSLCFEGKLKRELEELERAAELRCSLVLQLLSCVEIQRDSGDSPILAVRYGEIPSNNLSTALLQAIHTINHVFQGMFMHVHGHLMQV